MELDYETLMKQLDIHGEPEVRKAAMAVARLGFYYLAAIEQLPPSQALSLLKDLSARVLEATRKIRETPYEIPFQQEPLSRAKN